MKRFFLSFVLIPVLTLPSITACTPLGLVAGAGATVGLAGVREGGLSQATTDTRIQAYINDAWIRHDPDMFRRLDMTVREGRVLLTGVVPKPEQRVDAVRLAWQAPGVEQVINEVRVQNSEGITGYARDALITSKLKAKLVFDRDIVSVNYTVDTVGGIVYLMGVAQDQTELDRAIAHARNLAYVKEVVSYVRLKTQARVSESVPDESQPAGDAPVQW